MKTGARKISKRNFSDRYRARRPFYLSAAPVATRGIFAVGREMRGEAQA